MATTVKGFTHPETAQKYQLVKGSWNRVVAIAGGWTGKIKDMPPEAVALYLAKGRKDIVAIEGPPVKKAKDANQEPAAIDSNTTTK